MIMNKIIVIILVSLSLAGCQRLQDRALDQEWDSAQTLQQKRDLLLKLSKSPPHKPGAPKDVSEARQQYLNVGEENDDFLKGLTSSCNVINADMCVYDYYVRTKGIIDDKKKKVEARRNKIAVRRGDLFYCKVEFHLPNRIIDSRNIRVGVKDNIDTVGFVFSNGYQIISPKLEIVDAASEERQGMSAGGSLVVNASYDGSGYMIRLFDGHLDVETDKEAIRYVLDMGSSGGIDISDCKKAK